MVKIVGWEDLKADILRLVHDWLCGCEGKWLIVFNNVYDAEIFFVDAQVVIQS